MPKILRITTSPLSLRSLLSNQMKFMKANGFEVIMVSSDGKEWPSILQNEGCEHRIVPMAREISPLKDLRALWALYKLIKKEKPDIVHSHTPKAGLLSMLAAKMAGVKIRVHTIAGLRFMTATGMFRKLLVWMEKLTGAAATHVWPNSFSLLAYVKKNKLVSEKKLSVIGHGSSNGVDLHRFSPASLKADKLNEIRTLIGYEENNIYLLNMGRIVKDKGINELMQVFKKAHAARPSLRLVVLGHFEDKLDPVSEEARETLNNHPAIIHIDWNENVQYFMETCDLMVHASYREGFPNTLLQAGAMGIPIVCSRIEGNIDVVEDEKTGLLFRARDAGDLSEKLEKALNDPAQMKIYADMLRKTVREYFGQEYVHTCLRDKYLELLKNAKN